MSAAERLAEKDWDQDLGNTALFSARLAPCDWMRQLKE